jgi:hypothetical protein
LAEEMSVYQHASTCVFFNIQAIMSVARQWGVAKRKGSGLWIRHRWFESIHPSHSSVAG